MDKLPPELYLIITSLCAQGDLAVLIRSCRRIYKQCVRLLYEYNVKYDGSSALRAICQYKDQEASVAALTNAINARANLGRKFEQHLTVSLRSQYDAEPVLYPTPCKGDLTPLQLAASAGHPKVLSLLLQHEKNIDSRVQYLGWTALFFALHYRHSLAAKLLIDEHAALELASGINALHLAAATDLSDIIEYLVKEKELDLDGADRNGDTPLVHAITSPHATRHSISHLFRLGADLNKGTLRRGQYWSPLSIAIQSQRWELAHELLNNGADSEGGSGLASPRQQKRAGICHPLLLALCIKSPKNQKLRKKVVHKLLESVDPDMEVFSGSLRMGSFLSIVVQRKLQWETEILLNTRRVDVESRDSSDRTPLERALPPSSGSLEIAALLLRHGARMPKEPTTAILQFINNICQQADAIAIHETLHYNKVLAPLFQLLWNHCSSYRSEDRDEVMTAFIAGSPRWMVDAMTQIEHDKLTNTYVLERLKEKFDLGPRLPRRAKSEMIDWWKHRGVKRRLIEDQ
ncbi:ankyrin repeat-containing domain protein [Xylariaceae sp. FL1272]|nr:ankyrin repeat-containing domain protein [Xylariaceae sp. FL1272]